MRAGLQDQVERVLFAGMRRILQTSRMPGRVFRCVLSRAETRAASAALLNSCQEHYLPSVLSRKAFGGPERG